MQAATTLMTEPNSNGQGKAENSYTLTEKNCRTLAAELVLLYSVGVITQQDPDRVINDAARIIQAFLESKHINVSN